MSHSTQLPPHLTKALSEFGQWIREREKAYDVSTDRPVFHYTDANGLNGILSSNTLWFTDIGHLNDPSEFRFGRDFALDALKSAGAEAGTERLVRVFCERMLSGLDKAQQQFAMFVGSFSTNADELGQWRAYADDGQGFCLGVSKSVFAATDLQEDPLKNTVAIVIRYDEDEAKKEQQDGVDKALELLKRPRVKAACQRTQGIWKPFLQQLLVALAKRIYLVAAGFKHPAYQTEEEIRLLLINETEKLQPFVRTRVRQGALVPYIPWLFSPSLHQKGIVTDVRLGPAAPPSAEGAVHDLLSAYGISPALVRIERSRIPYRGT